MSKIDDNIAENMSEALELYKLTKEQKKYQHKYKGNNCPFFGARTDQNIKFGELYSIAICPLPNDFGFVDRYLAYCPELGIWNSFVVEQGIEHAAKRLNHRILALLQQHNHDKTEPPIPALLADQDDIKEITELVDKLINTAEFMTRMGEDR